MKINRIALAMLVSVSVLACKKENNSNSSNNTNNTNNNSSVLCDGASGESSYFPLKTGDSWTYDGETRNIGGTQTYNGNSYFDLHVKEGPNEYDNYYRVENDGIYEYIDVDSKEYLFIPASPVVNQEWDYRATFGVGKRKVISLTAEVKTSACDYKNVLQINEYDPDGSLNTTYYYKKGLGLVRYSVFGNTDLLAVTLK